VTPFDDDLDVSADDLLAGRAVPGGESLAEVLGQLRALADEPAPAPTPALAAVLRDGLPAAVLDRQVAAAGAPSRVARGLRWAAGLGVAGKVLLGAGVAAAAVAGTATLPVVPDSVQAPVRTALSDLGHLIPGSAGGSAPVPSATTPEPVDGVVRPVGPPSVGPDSDRAGDRQSDRRSGDPASTAPSEPGRATESSSGQGEDNNRDGRPSGARPTASPSRSTQDQQTGRGTPTGGPTTAAADGSGSGGSEGGQHQG
jgi:hypothetical protein